MTPEDWRPATPEEHLFDFDERFFALTGHYWFRWQWRLFEHFAKSEWPYQIDLPTGLGKTEVIALWEHALHQGWFQPILRIQIGATPIVVEDALRSFAKPIGFAEWKTNLVEKPVDDLKGSLPTAEEIVVEPGDGDKV